MSDEYCANGIENCGMAPFWTEGYGEITWLWNTATERDGDIDVKRDVKRAIAGDANSVTFWVCKACFVQHSRIVIAEEPAFEDLL